MRYSIGDIVEFKIGSIETDKGEVKFIEEDCNESTLYINSYSGWAYKVPEKKIVSRCFKWSNKFDQDRCLTV